MNQLTNPKHLSNNVWILSVLIGLFADIKCVNSFLVALYPTSSGIMAALYALTVVLILFYAFKGHHHKELTPCTLFIPLYCVVLYVFTAIFINQPEVGPLNFFVFSIIAYVIPLVSAIDVKTTLRSVMFFSIFSMLKLSSIFAFAYDYNDAISMGASYAYLIPVVGTIVYCRYYLKRDKGFQRMLSLFLIVCNVIFFLELFLFGSRGPLLAIACCIVLLFLFTEQGNRLVFSWKRLFLVIGCISILIPSFILVSSWLSDILKTVGISSYSLDKILSMAASNSLDNGRDDLSQLAMNGFIEYPILGHGSDLFDINYPGTSYPHNFILQILYDGGLLFFFLLIIPGIKGIVRLLRLGIYSQVAFFIFLFCVSVPGGLFSGDLWEQNMLWMCLGFLTNNYFVVDYEV